MEEIWKETEFEGYYISNMGNLKGRSGKIVNLQTNHNGYKCYTLYLNGRNSDCRCVRIHRLVAKAFIPNPDDKPQVNHIDGNKSNNRVTNLEWCTNQENSVHAHKNSLIKIKTGYSNSNSKLSKDDVLYIRTYYIPRDKNFGSRALGRKFNVTHTTIISIIKNERYKEN